MLMDIEENRCTGYAISFKDCTCISYSNEGTEDSYRKNPQCVVTVPGHAMSFVNCDGIGVAGSMVDTEIINCNMYVFRIQYGSGRNPNHQNIIKHVSSSTIIGASDKQDTNERGNQLWYKLTYKSDAISVEPVTKYITLQDVLWSKPRREQGVPVTTEPPLEILPSDNITMMRDDKYNFYRWVVNNKQVMAQQQYAEIND